MPIYIPRKIVPLKPTSQPLFFLAGPVRGGGNWQTAMATVILNRNPSAHIAIPCRWEDDHPFYPYFHEGRTFSSLTIEEAGNRQRHWEREYMEEAGFPDTTQPGCIIFWLGLESETDPHPGPEPYAMDTRREIGKWTAWRKDHHARMVIGGDRSFYGLDVIIDELTDADLGYRDGDFPFYTDMVTLVDKAFEEAQK